MLVHQAEILYHTMLVDYHTVLTAEISHPDHHHIWKSRAAETKIFLLSVPHLPHQHPASRCTLEAHSVPSGGTVTVQSVPEYSSQQISKTNKAIVHSKLRCQCTAHDDFYLELNLMRINAVISAVTPPNVYNSHVTAVNGQPKSKGTKTLFQSFPAFGAACWLYSRGAICYQCSIVTLSVGRIAVM